VTKIDESNVVIGDPITRIEVVNDAGRYFKLENQKFTYPKRRIDGKIIQLH